MTDRRDMDWIAWMAEVTRNITERYALTPEDMVELSKSAFGRTESNPTNDPIPLTPKKGNQ